MRSRAPAGSLAGERAGQAEPGPGVGESQGAVCCAGQGPAVLVDEVVVVGEAEQEEVGQAGAAAVCPGVDVVGGAPGGGDPAAGEPAAPVPGGQGAAQGGGVGAVAASDVEGQPVAPVDGGDFGLAGQGEDLPGGEHGPVGGPAGSRVRPG